MVISSVSCLAATTLSVVDVLLDEVEGGPGVFIDEPRFEGFSTGKACAVDEAVSCR